jgi:putative phage-type endonuclease
MKLIDCEQGSEDWFAARCGRVTASKIADLMARTKSGYSASRANYMAQLIAERLTGTVAESYTNAAMQWGKDQETNAAAMYAFMRDCELGVAGFVVHPEIDKAGASPDRLVGDDGLVEIKCPNTSTHLDTLLGSPIDGKYIKQMQFQMAVCEKTWCDFVSYDPRLPAEMQIHIERVERDDGLIKDIEAEVRRFLDELADKEERLRAKYLTQEAAE